MVLRPLRSAFASYPESDQNSACAVAMSTTVFNPFALREISRIRAMGRRPQVDASALARARRDLFGPIDHDDTRKFVMRELAAQQLQSSDRWGFDFEREEPIRDGPSSEKYFWEKVTEDDHVPQAYAHHEYSILSSETITAIAEDAHVSAAAPTPPASPLDAATSTCPSTSPEVETAKPTISVPKSTIPAVKRTVRKSTIPAVKRTSDLKSSMKRRRKDDVQQKKMTDFMRIRKSTSTDGAKIRRLSETTIASPTPQSAS